MSTRKPQSEGFGGSPVFDVLPKIAFTLVILISVPTFPSPIAWLTDVFSHGGDGAHLQVRLPRLAQMTDARGLGHYERLSINSWASASHILPSLIWLLLWPLQFTTSIRWKSPRFHRWVGTFLLVDAAAVLVGILPMSALGTCYNHKQPRPWPMRLHGFWTPPFMPLFWIYGATALLRGYIAVRRRQYAVHRRWMVRLNAVFLGVTLSRPVVITAVVVLDSHPRAEDLDFRWELFWGGIWTSMAFYVFVAEVWLAVESYFGLGKVSLRSPISSKKT